jgi:hypothetical protein
MAVTTSIESATPSLSDGKVVMWDIKLTYTNGLSGDEQYFTRTYPRIIKYDHPTNGFGLSAVSDWDTQAKLLALCPTSTWSARFDKEINSTFNPPAEPEQDLTYQIPTS